MAVSQFLRPGSLMDAVRGSFTPEIVRSASSFVGESESSTRQTLYGAVPAILAGLTNLVSSKDGANTLGGLIRDGRYSTLTDNARSLFSGGSLTTSSLSSGQQLLGTIFGNRVSSVTDAVARSGGVSPTSSTKLMSLAAPLALGVLGKRAAAQGLSASGVANSLLSEKSEIAAALPSGVAQIFGGAGPAVVPRAGQGSTVNEPVHIEHYAEPTAAGREPTVAGREPTARRMNWLPLVLAALAALALLLFLRARTPRNAGNVPAGTTQAREALSRIDLPSGTSLSVPEGSINYKLAQYLGDSSAQAPRTFLFDHLNFQTGTTELTPESTATVNDLSQVLKAYPNAQVQLAGHTDNTGSADANRTLSVARADAVKATLVNNGVAAERIATTGFGQDRPVASNDSEDGRAQNRRLELTVTNK